MGIFFALAAVCFGVTFFISHYRGVVGLGALAFATTAILMYTKYVSVDFYYDVLADDEDSPLFVVRQRVGKRDVTLCRIDLADVISIKRETAKERKEHKREKNTALYVYGPTLFPEVSYRLTVHSRMGKSEIILEGTDEFFAKISDYSKEAKQKRAQDEE